jgi:tetratricopeptide (TPR) repeat protein
MRRIGIYHLSQQMEITPLAKKRHSNRSSSAATRPDLPENHLSAGAAALAAGRFREAIEHFKALAKSGADPATWELGLTTAYRGRIDELLAKGMDREALILWELLSQRAPATLMDLQFLVLCLRHGRQEPVRKAYPAWVAQASATDLAQLQAHLAAAAVAGNPTLLAFLAEEDPLRRDAVPARAALEACCRGDAAAAISALRQIPFRSPFHDFVAVLKSLLLQQTDPVTSQRLRERIARDSPFQPLATAIGYTTLDEPAFLATLPQMGPQTRRLTYALRGWSTQRIRRWEEFQRLSSHAASADWLKFLNGIEKTVESGWFRRKLRAALLNLIENNRPRPAPSVLRAIHPLEQALALALAFEAPELPEETIDLWDEVFTHLETDHPRPWPPGSPPALRQALLQRRLFTHVQLQNTSEQQEAERMLEESLELDPEYLPGYLLLIRHYQNTSRQGKASIILRRALERWPTSVDLLNEELASALHKGSFKKAATLASRILAIDPIHRPARQRLIQAHMDHARKQVAKGRTDLALRELDQAEDWANRRDLLDNLQLMRALIEFRNGTASPETLQQIIPPSGSGLKTWFQLVLEAVQLGMDPAALFTSLGTTQPPTPQREDLLTLAAWLRDTAQRKYPKDILNSLFQPFLPLLETAAQLPGLLHDEFANLCESLSLVGQRSLCKAFAQAALDQWPEDPLFILHVFQSSYRIANNRIYVSSEQFERLEAAMLRAHAADDQRTALRLSNVLDRLIPIPSAFLKKLEQDSADDHHTRNPQRRTQRRPRQQKPQDQPQGQPQGQPQHQPQHQPQDQPQHQPQHQPQGQPHDPPGDPQASSNHSNQTELF